MIPKSNWVIDEFKFLGEVMLSLQITAVVYFLLFVLSDQMILDEFWNTCLSLYEVLVVSVFIMIYSV